MSSLRAADRDFIRLIQAAATPIFIVDDARRIVFLNEACARWCGVPAEQLLGQICRYQSGELEGPAAAADSICPPPEALGGCRIEAVVSRVVTGTGIERRLAQFLPLNDENGQCISVLAIIDPFGAPPEASQLGNRVQDESAELHELVRHFRHEMTAWHHVERLAGHSPAMQRVRAQVEMAAASRASVLICGPEGCGAAQIARSIHFARQPQVGAFVPISCAALPADLLRSTFAAVGARRGQSATEAPATMLLNDVQLLPAEVQPEVARWLADPLRATRVISTAPGPLEMLAERGGGGLRPDLAILLSTFTIQVPALVDRPDDIPLVVQMLVEDLNAAGQKQLRGLSPQSLDRLVAHHWPGNLDELAAVIREAFTSAEGAEIAEIDLPKRLFQAAEAKRHPRKEQQAIDLEKLLAQLETQLIERALHGAKRNKSKAARLLGLSRPRLYRRMVQLGMIDDDSQATAGD